MRDTIVLDLPTHLYIDRVVGGGSVWHDKNPLCFWQACIIYVTGTTYYTYLTTADVYQDIAKFPKHICDPPLGKKVSYGPGNVHMYIALNPRAKAYSW